MTVPSVSVDTAVTVVTVVTEHVGALPAQRSARSKVRQGWAGEPQGSLGWETPSRLTRNPKAPLLCPRHLETSQAWVAPTVTGRGLLPQGEDGPPGNGTEGFPGFPVSVPNPHLPPSLLASWTHMGRWVAPSSR